MRRLALFTQNPPRLKLSFKSATFAFFSILTLLSVGAAYLNAQLLRDEFHELAIKQGFTPKIIEISGRDHTEKQAILDIIEPLKGSSILAIDLEDLRQQILTLGWIEDAVIIRTLPDQLKLHLKERRPIALMQTPSGHQLIDDTGMVITGADPAEFSHLLVVSGKGAETKAAVIIDILHSEPELFSDVWAVQHISERRWDVHMRSGLTIRLPEQDPVLAWSRLAKLEQETAITDRDLAAIDLRVPGQLIVEPNIPIRGKGRKT
jgi:cell division protein FtsQ